MVKCLLIPCQKAWTEAQTSYSLINYQIGMDISGYLFGMCCVDIKNGQLSVGVQVTRFHVVITN